MLRIFRPPHCCTCDADKEEEEDIPVEVVRLLSDRAVLVRVPSLENACWVLKFARSKANRLDVSSWDESALQRFLHENEPDIIAPLALDTDYVSAKLGRSTVWRAVKATLYVSENQTRKRKRCGAGASRGDECANSVHERFEEAKRRIERLLRQSVHVTDARDDDWACKKKNVIRPTPDTFLFHDFDRNVR